MSTPAYRNVEGNEDRGFVMPPRPVEASRPATPTGTSAGASSPGTPSAGATAGGASATVSRPRSELIRSLLQIPLFHKLLLANAAILGLVALVASIITARAADNGTSISLGTSLLVIGAGIVLTLAANGAIVWVALTPLRELAQTAAHVRAGDLSARAATSPVADADLHRLIVTFNDVLDAVADRSRRLREMAARATAAAEEERRRVAGELHDGIAQSMAALNLRLRLARSANDPQVRDAVLEEVSGGISDAILELRRMARGLRPPALEMLGLPAAMSSHAQSVSEAAGIAVDVRADDVAGKLSREAELSLYRILQESLSNVVRHSGASHVSIRLVRKDGSVELTIEDDGKGFDPATARDGDRGLGLFGMEERAAVMGGTLTIHSVRGEGTRITAAVPVLEGTPHAR